MTSGSGGCIHYDRLFRRLAGGPEWAVAFPETENATFLPWSFPFLIVTGRFRDAGGSRVET